MTAPRPLPRLDAHNRPFWTGGAEGELRIMRCQDCATFIHPPRPVCSKCLSENVAPEAVAGSGVVDTFTVNYQKWHPAMEVPFVIARIALDGVPGVYLTSNIINCDVEKVDIGDRVHVKFERQDDVYLPLFEKMDQTL
ncbi:Zn-ribbon domain-containing OB-fold protein [Zhongshania sp.]|uniref:Zn-ribbon domain-containing OB-fold protein n=1 Tax=Zhongshania sp. TaxID=1971902 RepID=UPI003563FC0F